MGFSLLCTDESRKSSESERDVMTGFGDGRIGGEMFVRSPSSAQTQKKNNKNKRVLDEAIGALCWVDLVHGGNLSTWAKNWLKKNNIFFKEIDCQCLPHPEKYGLTIAENASSVNKTICRPVVS
jgi:hypothetical protein